MQTVLGFIANKYVYIVAFAIGLLSIIDWVETKNKWKRVLLSVVILSTTFPSIWEMVTYVPQQSEVFSIEKNNIKFLKGDSGNIMFKTAKTIDDPIDLRIKDTWIHLTNATDYKITGNIKCYNKL